jgi:hypothetical protein
MRVLYVGHYQPGCTTWARGQQLIEILKPSVFQVVDIDQPINNTPRLFRSFGWRFYKGPLIHRINSYIEEQIKGKPKYDLVWIDKGVFIRPAILKRLSMEGSTLVHYTPDTAFAYNRSKLFFDALPLYNHCITTKSFELEEYRKMGAQGIHYSTQGYDPLLHKKYYTMEEKDGIVFIGLHEEWREKVVEAIVSARMKISIGGAGWKGFALKMKNNPYFHYLGESLFHEQYARAISKSKISIGLLSRRFSEKHTTRTFEIPACFTALATERNDEILSFYMENEVIYFGDIPELIQKLSRALSDPEYLELITVNGFNRVRSGGYDYKSILENLVKEMGLK